MRNAFDFTPYRRSTVGFDRLFEFLENSGASGDNYPPFDIEQMSDDQFRITVAVAGFKQDEIEIVAHQNMLTVSGRKASVKEGEGRKLLHSGIATRAFERRFQLADFVLVKGADMADGLLTIDLQREVPEAMKPQRIAIGETKLELVDASREAA